MPRRGSHPVTIVTPAPQITQPRRSLYPQSGVDTQPARPSRQRQPCTAAFRRPENAKVELPGPIPIFYLGSGGGEAYGGGGTGPCSHAWLSTSNTLTHLGSLRRDS